VTNYPVCKIFYTILLGFERKARLFCDNKSYFSKILDFLLGFERKARLFCDGRKSSELFTHLLLGFDRLFCDKPHRSTLCQYHRVGI